MSKFYATDDEKKELKKNIRLFQVECEYYKNKDKTFNEDTLNELIDTIYSHLINSKESEILKILFRENWHKSVTDLLKCFLSRCNWDLFDVICNHMINYTDKFELVCESLVAAGLADVLIDAYISANDNTLHPPTNKLFFITIITIVHNIARHVHLQQYFLQHDDINRFKQLILSLSLSNDQEKSIVVTFVLTWLAKEDSADEKKILEEHSGIIASIFLRLKETLSAGGSGFSTWELLLGLQALSAIDSINMKMITLDGLVSTLIVILTSPLSSPKEVELSLGIIWNLSFIDSNRHLLQTKYDIETVVEPLTQSQSKKIRHNAKGLLWDHNKQRSGNVVAKSHKYELFLSYCHAQKDLVAQIERRLKSEYRVWIDKDNLKGSGLDDMAAGIEQSAVFVMCVSNSYKQSQYCHSEANYAYRMKRPIIPLVMEHKYKPDGWLGIICSSEFYIDVSDSAKFTESMTKLTDVIKHKLCGVESVDRPVCGQPTLAEQPRKFREWDRGEVSQWLLEMDLDCVRQKLEEFDGGMIDAMMTMKVEAPQIYYKSLEKKLTFTFPEIMKFSSALGNLKYFP